MSLEIPSDFHSDSDEKPFVRCKVCDRDLIEDQVPYTIEKAFKRTAEGEDVTLFELAICIPCAEKQSEKMSKESRDFLARALQGGDFFQKRQAMWNTKWRHDWKERCIFSDNEVSLNDEYHIVGHFQGNEIIPFQTPFIIGQEMIEYIQENLSLETKEEMDNFGKQFLGPDPSLKSLLENYQFVMV
ncbi:MAG: hypothetical protein R3277_11420 [Brumimicrobium sp.]|nr:hypothetical protein [Brumimicrobium sp.]